MTTENQYFSASSKQPIAAQACAEVATQFENANLQSGPDLVVVFASPHFNSQLQSVVDLLHERLSPGSMVGCTGQGIVHDGEEIEEDPCLSVWAAWIPGCDFEVSHLRYDRQTGGFDGHGAKLSEADWAEDTSLLAVTEPYTFPTDVFLESINREHPGVPVVGGVASGGMGPNESQLICNQTVVSEGGVVARLQGAPLTPVVSQGCRPVGEHFVITKAEQNEILELGGIKAHQQLKAIYDRLPTRDKDLIRLGIHMGRVVNEYQDSFSYGDFLIRNVTGMNPDNESVIVGDYFRPGQTVQFHVRDAVTADEDLRQMLSRAEPSSAPKAALLFTCNGRGSRFFEKPDHDALAIRQQFGELPVTGFFCQGEMGPVGGQNFLHGFTASVALWA